MNDFRHTTQVIAAGQRELDGGRLILAHAFAAITQKSLGDAIHDHVPGGQRLVKAAAATTGTMPGLADIGSAATRTILDRASRTSVLGRLLAAGALPAAQQMAVTSLMLESDPVWVGEGRPIPIGLLSSSDVLIPSGKYGTILALTRTLFRHVDERTLAVIQRVTARRIARSDDRLLLSTAGAEDDAPAGVLAGLSPVATGSPSTLAEDLEALWRAVRDGDPEIPRFVMSPRAAMYLAALRGADGAPLFPDVSPSRGGTLFGVEVLLSPAAGHRLVLVDAAMLAINDGELEVTRGEQATVQMVDPPTNISATATPSMLVSAFQTGTVVLRLVRWTSWWRLADDAVGYLELPIAGSPS